MIPAIPDKAPRIQNVASTCPRRLIPENFAASGLPPTAYKYRPNVVFWVTKAPTHATDTKMRTGIGTPAYAFSATTKPTMSAEGRDANREVHSAWFQAMPLAHFVSVKVK